MPVVRVGRAFARYGSLVGGTFDNGFGSALDEDEFRA